MKLAKDNIQKAKISSKKQFDKKAKEKQFEKGELVLLHDPTVKRGRSKKLRRPWIGPY